MQKVCFSDTENSLKPFHLNCDPWEAIIELPPKTRVELIFLQRIVVIPTNLY
ncbi:hypothetical protein LEP1GSC021_2845 [Leptospira noguchii str. 1993005606]|nr:hypothetical protein LEP1GSC021_2845 [Leptospira noguchii str. 1993005606]